ncbi:uncharacterized protein LOC141640987 [Silene latifolia]|uniref:uncharacterized protein LOC141640987 n=1 Tax=Silene latifolia TaxID=37657 RepID=UPI003D787FA9
MLGFSDGQFPFRYLGVPLSPSTLSVTMFDSLLLKIKHVIQHWSTHLLTYAERVQLLTSVVLGLGTFWRSCILLPQEVLKNIKKLCKDFFWGIPFEGKRMVFKKWQDICLPWDAGGYNIKDLSNWNAALLCRWIHLLSYANVGSWETWHHSYVLQHQNVCLNVRDRLIVLAGNIPNAKVLLNSMYSNGLVHPRIVPSHRIVCSLAVQKQLATVDNLQHRGFHVVNRCSLCEAALEDHNNLFFTCPFSSAVWEQILNWMSLLRAGASLLEELKLAGSGSKHDWKVAWFGTSLAAVVHQIWIERNSRLFQGRKTVVAKVVCRIKFLISTRMLMWKEDNEAGFPSLAHIRTLFDDLG